MKNTDELSVLLAISIIMSFLAFLLTDMAQPRYITLVPYAAVVLLVRNSSKMITYFPNRQLSILIIAIVSDVSFAGKVYEVLGYQYPQSNIEDYKLITFLDEHNLHYGYASFWNASKITVLSSKKINIRHSGETDDMLSIYKWFCKNEWYKEDTNFILINNEDGKAGEESIREHQHYFTKKELVGLMERHVCVVVTYKRFELGLNELIVGKKE